MSNDFARIVHLIVFGVTPKQEGVIEKWKQICRQEEWKLYLWSRPEAEYLLFSTFPNLGNWWLTLSHVQQQVDVIQYLVVLLFGGLVVPSYAMPFDNALKDLQLKAQDSNLVMVWAKKTQNEEDGQFVEPGVFYSPKPKHVVLEAMLGCLMQTRAMCMADHDWCVPMTTGILSWSRVVSKTSQDKIRVEPNTWLKQHMFKEGFEPISEDDIRVLSPQASALYTNWRTYLDVYRSVSPYATFALAALFVVILLLAMAKSESKKSSTEGMS